MNAELMQYMTFWVGANLCAVNALDVQEILHYQKITPVALTPEYVRGLMNLRGNILTVIDLRRLFGLPSLPDETTGMHLVVQAEGEAISFFVDRMDTIVEIVAEQLLPPPDTAQSAIARYIASVSRVDDHLMMLLNLETVLDIQERG
ncbi:CheW protein [Candidatus Moduliflexus flocculans]|uniref:CheW protein n=1 Tax=Candidatus Moduliflexus flocculans TaxID=1499966 RepID=A0A0S6W380_9BACT|nr:CheW protein [Candidatus Moduliflexus flocculans]